MIAVMCCVALTLARTVNALDDKTNGPGLDQSDCVPRAALNAYVNRSILRKADVFRSFPARKGGVVFLGSSIIEEGPWDRLFPGMNAINRGISADTTRGVLSRLDEVIGLKPRQVVLYIGGNDFSREGRDVAATAASLDNIIDTLLTSLPNVKIVVMGLFPRELQHAEKIKSFNAQIEKIEKNRVATLNLFDLFAQPGGAINPKFTNDSIHLMGAAYKIWGDALKPFLVSEQGDK